MISLIWMLGLAGMLFASASAHSQDAQRFEQLLNLDWREDFHDPFTEDWRKRWFLDGQKAQVIHSDQGMDFQAGPVRGEDASHAVLWTKDTFEGDLRIEYEYSRLDNSGKSVTILYIQATGSGESGHDKDISKWSDRRVVPAMSQYFNHMNLYHISYAASKMDGRIRARRYLPETGNRLKGTALMPDYFRTGFFQTGVRHKITVVKHGVDLFMRIEAQGKTALFHWNTSTHPPITEGRIGLRHMWTRAARYLDFRVLNLK